MISKLFSHI